MRLINTSSYKLQDFPSSHERPAYAILSHTWRGSGEATYHDLQTLNRWSMRSMSSADGGTYHKVYNACRVAKADGLRWLWIDSCCIDHSSSAEVQEAINEMWSWYAGAEVCYGHLEDLSNSLVQWTKAEERALYRQLSKCRWFARSWTLPELLAPRAFKFYDGRWTFLGTRDALARTLAKITGIDMLVLIRRRRISTFSIATRMSWASKRQARRIEDRTYSLLGIFDVYMPICYGEGARAFRRLQEELIRNNLDQSIFVWAASRTGAGGEAGETDPTALLASSPSHFAEANGVVSWGRPGAFELTNRGLRASLPLLRQGSGGPDDVFLAILNCRYLSEMDTAITLRLQRYPGSDQFYISATVAKGESSRASFRLITISSHAITAAEYCTVEIARKREEHQNPGVKFWLRPSASNTCDPAPYVVRIEPSEFWDPSAKLLLAPPMSPHVRAWMLLRLPTTMRDVVLEFGYDEHIEFDSMRRTFSKNYIPGLRVLFVGRCWSGRRPGWAGGEDSPYWYCSHDSSKGSGCADAASVHRGCRNTPNVAEIGMPGDPETFRIELRPETVMGENVFVLQVDVTRVFELQAVEVRTGSRPVSGGTDASYPTLPPYSPGQSRTLMSHGQTTVSSPSAAVALADEDGRRRSASPYALKHNPQWIERPTQQRILLSNAHGKFWKLFPEGMLEVVQTRKFDHRGPPIPIQSTNAVGPASHPTEALPVKPRQRVKKAYAVAAVAKADKSAEAEQGEAGPDGEKKVTRPPSQVWFGLGVMVMY
jgi:hypothetical protein